MPRRAFAQLGMGEDTRMRGYELNNRQRQHATGTDRTSSAESVRLVGALHLPVPVQYLRDHFINRHVGRIQLPRILRLSLIHI